jgi:protein gp37
MARRFGKNPRGVWNGTATDAYPKDGPFPFGFEPTFYPDRLDKPLHWRKPRRIFVCSMSDLFHEAFTDEQIARVLGTMALGQPDAFKQNGRWWPTAQPHHTYLVLTKRPERMLSLFSDPEFPNLIASVSHIYPMWPMPHLWLGVTVESEDYMWRAEYLSGTPAARRFISFEPLLAPVDLSVHQSLLREMDWLIVGGENGPGARPMAPEWALDLYRQAKAAGGPFWWKGWGASQLGGGRKGGFRCDPADADDYLAMQQTRELPEVGR